MHASTVLQRQWRSVVQHLARDDRYLHPRTHPVLSDPGVVIVHCNGSQYDYPVQAQRLAWPQCHDLLGPSALPSARTAQHAANTPTRSAQRL